MKKLAPKLRAGLLFLFLLTFASYPAFRWWSEPQYQRRRISSWFQEYCRATSYNLPSFPRGPVRRTLVDQNGQVLPDPAQDALHQLGAAAAPFLTRRLSRGNLRATPGYAKAWLNVPAPLRFFLPQPGDDRIAAATALAGLGPANHQAVPQLIDLIIQQPGRRSGSLLIPLLPAFSPAAPEIERLVDALTDAGRYPDVKATLERCSVRTTNLVSSLCRILENNPEGWVFQILRDCGPLSRPATPALLRHCASTDSEIRYQAVRTFEAMGLPDPEILPVLNSLSADSNPMVQSVATRLLQSAEPRQQKAPPGSFNPDSIEAPHAIID